MFNWRTICATAVLAKFILIQLSAQSLVWETIEPGLFNSPNYSGSYGGLNGIDGNFYIWTSLKQDPFYAVYRSIDGIDWEEVGPGTRCDKGIKLSNGKVLLYGGGDDVVIGQDSSWEVFDAAPDYSTTVLDAVEGNGRIVLVGNSRPLRTSVPAWMVSTDGGASFSHFHDPDYIDPVDRGAGLESIVYADGKFVAVGLGGVVWTSINGEEWTSHDLPTISFGVTEQLIQLFDVAYANGAFYAVGSFATLFKSVDGISWELLLRDPSAGIFNRLEKILIDGDNWYAAGSAGDMIWSMDGGKTWEQYFRSGNLSDLTGGDGRYYAGNNIVLGGGPISPERDLNLGFWESFSARDVAFTQGKWLVIQSLTQTTHFGSPDSSDAGFLDSAMTTDAIYYEHPWFGWFAMRSGDWVYHFNMGWVYAPSESNVNVWMYTDGLDWIFTSDTLWPYFFHLGSGHWGLYAGGSDWFWNETLQAWMQRHEFYTSPWVVNKEWLYLKGIVITDSAGIHGIVPALVEPAFRQAQMSLPYPNWNFDTFTAVDLFENIVADTSREAGLVPGRQFTYSFNPQFTDPQPEPNILKIILTFDNDEGGTSRISYDFGPGFQADSIEGTFQVTPGP